MYGKYENNVFKNKKYQAHKHAKHIIFDHTCARKNIYLKLSLIIITLNFYLLLYKL